MCTGFKWIGNVRCAELFRRHILFTIKFFLVFKRFGKICSAVLTAALTQFFYG
uniref:Uncharacterized protein n=1 Tax=Anguilla anguilla TaxID=7936 RepID=A0A0E9XFU1_ANGAN